jgi:hypothetical protein
VAVRVCVGSLGDDTKGGGEEGGTWPSSTERTRCAKLSEHVVSCVLVTAGLTLTNIIVLLSPPSESCSRYVSLELRYGTCADLEVSAKMTSPRLDSDLLIACAGGGGLEVCARCPGERASNAPPQLSPVSAWNGQVLGQTHIARAQRERTRPL